MKNKIVMTQASIAVIMGTICSVLTIDVSAQKIFSADREYQADIKVFVIDSEYNADLKVFFTDKEYHAGLKKNDKKPLLY